MSDLLRRYPALHAEALGSPIVRAHLYRPTILGDEAALASCVIDLSRALRLTQEAHAKLLAEGPVPVVVVRDPGERGGA